MKCFLFSFELSVYQMRLLAKEIIIRVGGIPVPTTEGSLAVLPAKRLYLRDSFSRLLKNSHTRRQVLRSHNTQPQSVLLLFICLCLKCICLEWMLLISQLFISVSLCFVEWFSLHFILVFTFTDDTNPKC